MVATPKKGRRFGGSASHQKAMFGNLVASLFGPEVGAPAPPLVRVRLTVAYDGRGFHGFAVQDGVRTVGGELTIALRRALRHDVMLTCAGRTDSGVHALGQVVSFDAEAARF